MRRRLFHWLIALSLLMGLLSTFLWIESYVKTQGVWLTPSDPFVVRNPSTQLPSSWSVQWCASWDRGSFAFTRKVDCVSQPQSRTLELAPPPASPAALRGSP